MKTKQNDDLDQNELDIINSAIDYNRTFIIKLRRQKKLLNKYIKRLAEAKRKNLVYRFRKWQIPVDK